MADPFTGEIRIFPFNYAPPDWAFCDGSTLQILQYQALYAVIGITYGGDGRQTFMLPNLLGYIPMEQGAGPGLTFRKLGDHIGTTTVALTSVNQIASHQHAVTAYVSPDAPIATPTNTLFMSRTSTGNAWSDQSPNVQMYTQTFTASGGGPGGAALPHENRQPYLALNFCICVNGYFPVRPD